MITVPSSHHLDSDLPRLSPCTDTNGPLNWAAGDGPVRDAADVGIDDKGGPPAG